MTERLWRFKSSLAHRSLTWADGEIGIHVRFRSVSRKGWRFESSSAHTRSLSSAG